MWEKSKWIWTENPERKNTFVRFRIDFFAPKGMEKANLSIAAETKYYLYLNGVLTVFDGGLHRESTLGNGYYDTVPLNVKEGKNRLEIDVWFWGNGGRNNKDFPLAGLLFECKELELYSDENVLCGVLNAYYETKGEQPAYLYGGYNIGFDANRDTVNFAPAKIVSEPIGSLFGTPVPRPIPLFAFGKNVSAEFKKNGNQYTVKLPYAMQFSPYMKIHGHKGAVIDIRSDRYYVNGGPGDDKFYRGHRYEYVCKDGLQSYSGYNYLFGEKIIFTVPDGQEVISLGYRESGYDCDIKYIPRTNDAILNKLLKKCARTLKVCMRENFMDCPDRERGQWIGDVSVQSAQVFICLSDNAKYLLRKAIVDFITLRKGDALYGNVPGIHSSELPSQSLNAISEVGMIANYYNYTGEKDILKLSFEPAVNYLKLWNMGEDGFVMNRQGTWPWFDHNFNIDGKVLENCWYYSALKFALFMAKELDDRRFDDFLSERKKFIEENFENAFWKEYGYASGDFFDDRANAMAVISGLYNKNHTDKIRRILVSVFNATTYMEGYILEALCILGYKDDAYKRMMSRYYPLTVNENSTLWEDFFILGTKNHAWSGAPLTITEKYFKDKIIR